MPTISSVAGNDRTTGAQASITTSITTDGNSLILGVGFFDNTLLAYGTAVFDGDALVPTIRMLVGLYNFQWFVLQSAAAKTANLVITPTANKFITFGALCISDFGAITRLTQNNASSTTPSVTIPSSIDELIIDMLIQDNNGQTYTEGAGQTKLYQNADGTNSAYSAMSSEPGGSPTTTMSWTLGSSDAWSQGAIAVVGAAGGGGGQRSYVG